jgi:hypothetical protein
MPRYYFHQHMNGRRLAEDRRGRLFGNVTEACTYALCRARPAFSTGSFAPLPRIRTSALKYPMRTLFIIRGKITSEKA